MQINISSNYKRLSRSLDQVGRKQLPFAFAKTLNKTMKAVEKYIVARTYPRAFDVRNRAFFKASMFTGTAVKRARSGRIAIPSRYTKATRGARGVRKALRPRAVVNTPKGFIDRDGPRDAIYQRYGRGGKQVRLLYVLHRSAKIPKRFRFYEDAERIIRSVSPKLFRKNFSQAIRTARR